MWVVEGSQRARFPLKAGQSIGVRSEHLGQDLQSDIALQSRVTRAVDLAHPTRADHRDDLVRADPRARGEAHFGVEWAHYMAASARRWAVGSLLLSSHQRATPSSPAPSSVPRASTEGRATENSNEIGVRLWTALTLERHWQL